MSWATLTKEVFVGALRSPTLDPNFVARALQALLSIVALVLTVPVWRRLGFAYGVYNLLIVGLPFLTTSTFVGMGRYILAAFPAFAVAAALLCELSDNHRRRWTLIAVALVANGLLLVLMHSYFVRWYLIA